MKPWMTLSLVLVLLLTAACTTPQVAPAVPATATVAPAETATEVPATDTPVAETATSTPVTLTATAETAAAWEPLDSDACAALAEEMAKTLGVEVTQDEAPLTDPATGQSGTGCQATASGSGEQFASPDAVVTSLAGMLEA